MSRRALAEKRPLLLASIAAALAFYYLRWGPFPELYLIPIKGAAAGLLAVYLRQRHSSPDARLMAWAFGAAALGDMALEVTFDRTIGGLLFFAYHVMAMGVYLRNRRAALSPTQKGTVAAMLLLTPVIAWFMPVDRAQAPNLALYALALGAMAASAWASVFSRYRVGAGAALFLVSDLLIFAESGPLQYSVVPQVMAWPIYYLGQFLIATGIAQTLRKRDPELRVVVNN
ncbi:MAG TPA: lysoplasmalogenase family protein [Rhizobiaceae bacterium]|nr:lysoplasmalogenase family protein [Rhizobiaceae bacterium]